MSTFNDEIECPNCGTKISECTITSRPFTGVLAQCHCCGFKRETVQEQMSLEELNDYRQQYSEILETKLPLLTELPKFDNNLIR